MELKLNSLSARLYRYFYETNKMPNSLCTYFWKLVIAYLLIIPLEIIGLPFTIYIKFFDKDQTPTKDYSDPATKAVASSIFVTVLFVIVLMLVPIIQFFTPIERQFVIDTLIFDVVIISVILYCLTGVYNFLIIDLIKAKLRKVCPKINWN